MRPATFIAATLALASGAFAKSVIISFEDKNTPDSVLERARQDIISAGGEIKHSFNIIKAFVAEVPEEGIQTLQSWGAEEKMRIEDNQEVSIF